MIHRHLASLRGDHPVNLRLLRVESWPRSRISPGCNGRGTSSAERHITLVYGGGHVGLMGLLADATMAAGGEVHGVITRALERMEVAHRGLSRLQVAESMHDRKLLMTEASDGFVMLPEGLGTLEEFFEATTWTQLFIHSKPCGILNIGGYFDPLISFLDRSVEERFLRREHRDQLVVDSDPKSLIATLASWEPAVVDKWIDRDGN